MTVTERQNYDSIMWTEIDRMATEAFARKQGKAEGLAEGRAEALNQVKLAVAMIKNGSSVQEICTKTGLTPEDVKALQ